MKILVIDDEQMIRDLAARILTRAGYEVELAESGQAGVDRFHQLGADIDLVLLDLSLDDLSGEDVLAHLRRTAPDLPCIISSGHSLANFELPDKLKPSTHFLEKPYRASQLSHLVADILKI
jgi:DNA-binding NtrC family response regulator